MQIIPSIILLQVIDNEDVEIDKIITCFMQSVKYT